MGSIRPQNTSSYHRLPSFLFLVLCSLFSGLMAGCGEQEPIELVREKELPLFIDDGPRSTLLASARNQIEYLRGLPEKHSVPLGDRKYPKTWLLHSLESFIQIVKNTPADLELNRKIRDQFLVFKAAGREGKPKHQMLVTGYYEPLFAGSLTAEPPYIHPLYNVPDSLVKLAPGSSGKQTVGRYDSAGNLAPFWTRKEIETSEVLDGHELVYLKDPVDAFLLHVQGSGRIQLPDNSVQSVRFAGHNGHQYNSIGKLLVDEGKIDLEDASVPTIRDYLARHPEELARVLHHNPRFIFFDWGNGAPPRGSSGVSLTPGRSVAVDPQVLPSETIGYLVSRKPVVDSDGRILDWISLTRFVMPQDSGSAIKGAGRVDLFYGAGTYAEAAAGNTAERGELYFLIKKGYNKISEVVSTTGLKE